MDESMYQVFIKENWRGMSYYSDTFLRGIIVLASSKEVAKEKAKQVIATLPTHIEETFWLVNGKAKHENVLIHRKIEKIVKLKDNVFMDYYTGTG